MPTRCLFVIPLFAAVIVSAVIAEPLPDQKTIVPAGSENAGKTLFVEKGCYQCHVAGDIKTPASELDDSLLINLGGRDHAGWTRDDFARAIMSPQHTVSEEYRRVMMSLGDNFKAENSPMPGFNDILSVSDLIHLTTFLENLPE